MEKLWGIELLGKEFGRMQLYKSEVYEGGAAAEGEFIADTETSGAWEGISYPRKRLLEDVESGGQRKKKGPNRLHVKEPV